MTKTIRTLIADDQDLFLTGLSLMLEEQNSLQVSGAVKDGRQVIEFLEKHEVDLVLMDIEMPQMDGREATHYIKQHFPKTAVLALTQIQDDQAIVDMINLGARGYLLKETTLDELVEAARAVTNGGTYVCEAATPLLLRRIAQVHSPYFRGYDPNLFTPKEIEIIRLICQEYSSKQIAPALDLTFKTVQNYRAKILEKMGVQNTAGIVVYAIQNGLYKI